MGGGNKEGREQMQRKVSGMWARKGEKKKPFIDVKKPKAWMSAVHPMAKVQSEDDLLTRARLCLLPGT